MQDWIVSLTSAVGALVLLKLSVSTSLALYTALIKPIFSPSKSVLLKKYKRDGEGNVWAIVTGASDGKNNPYLWITL
jgi:hypothetical protein